MAHHGKHAELENDIDALLLRRYKKKKPSEFNQAATICLNGLETQFISRHLAKCINDAYYPDYIPEQFPDQSPHGTTLHSGPAFWLPHII